jgi:hypothetical protein
MTGNERGSLVTAGRVFGVGYDDGIALRLPFASQPLVEIMEREAGKD